METKAIDLTTVEDNATPQDAIIEVEGLNFSYFGTKVIHDITFSLQPGDRALLVGANGAGKSTLLRLLGGKHLAPRGSLKVLGLSAPQDQVNGLAFLGNNWQRTVAFAGHGVAYQADIPVSEMSKTVQAKYPERRDYLVDLLEIDLSWKMHKISDGQRRRVQIMLALLRPFRVLILDEMTVDLDVLSRAALLSYLRREAEERKATIVYTTHIFDGLDGWGTHLLHLSDGRLRHFQRLQDISELQLLRASPTVYSPLLRLVHDRLFEERAARRAAGRAAAEAEGQHDADASLAIHGKQGGFESGRFYNYW